MLYTGICQTDSYVPGSGAFSGFTVTTGAGFSLAAIQNFSIIFLVLGFVIYITLKNKNCIFL